MISAVQRGTTTPSAAPGQVAVALDDEVGRVIDELGVQPHDGVTSPDLMVVEEPDLQLVDRCLNEALKSRKVVGRRR
jgi:hypothetical protein